MNNDRDSGGTSIGDRIALEIQSLHSKGKLANDLPLLRIDNRTEAAQAPFQFDVAEAVLHRSTCPHIPARSQSALYAVWEIHDEDLRHACPHCKPSPQVNRAMEQPSASDLLFGVLSIIDQFGAVLTERGREFRDSDRGRSVESTIQAVITELDAQQKQSFDLLLSSLDGLLTLVKSSSNGHEHRQHEDAPGSARKQPAEQAAPPRAESAKHTTNGRSHNGTHSTQKKNRK